VSDGSQLVFERRERSRTLLIGSAVFVGVCGLMARGVEGVEGLHVLRATGPCFILSCICLALAGFRLVYTLENTELRARMHWLRWRLPTWFVLTRPNVELHALRYGPSFVPLGGEPWSLYVITSDGRMAMEYGDLAEMQADLDRVRELCPAVSVVADQIDVPGAVESQKVMEGCERKRSGLLWMALVCGVCGLVAIPFVDLFLVGLCLVGACLCLWGAGFRVTYTLQGWRLIETVRWYRWRAPTWLRYSLPTGTGVLREVVRSPSFKTRWAVHLMTSGGIGTREYPNEAAMEADLDSLRALCPGVTIETLPRAKTGPALDR